LVSRALLVALSSLALGGIASGEPSQMPATGCIDRWVSNGTWSARIKKVQNLPNRVDLSMQWRNDSSKPRTPGGVSGFTDLEIAYADGSSIGIFDQVTQDNPGPDTHADDLLAHRFAPREVRALTLSFYFSPMYSVEPTRSISFPRREQPIEFDAGNGTGDQNVVPIRIKVNCSAR